jgi:F0F1-type ATP synthase membrane subunit b/b'
MGTKDRKHSNGEGPNTGLGSLRVDVDMDPEMRRIMSETQETIRQSFVSASRAREETIAQAQTEADRMRADAENVLADARTEADKLIADSKAETEARQKEAEKRAAHQLAQAANQAEELLRDARAEHATLTEAVPRLRAVVAESDTFMDAFRDAMRRFEEATGDMMVSDETDTSPPASPEDDDGTVPGGPSTDSSPDDAEDRKAAANALKSLST